MTLIKHFKGEKNSITLWYIAKKWFAEYFNEITFVYMHWKWDQSLNFTTICTVNCIKYTIYSICRLFTNAYRVNQLQYCILIIIAGSALWNSIFLLYLTCFWNISVLLKFTLISSANLNVVDLNPKILFKLKSTRSHKNII